MSEIVALVQLPPPIHGAAVMNQRVIDVLRERGQFRVKAFRLNYAQTFEQMHAPWWIKCRYTLFLTASILACYVRHRPRITYIAFAPFGGGFYRDLILLLVARLFSSRPHLHLHGTGLSQVRSGIKRLLLRLMFQRSKLIILSESLFEDIRPFVSRSRVAVVNNSVPDPGPIERIRSKGINLLYVANLDPRKGVLTAISVCAHLRRMNIPVYLTIVGADTVYMSADSLRRHILNQYSDIAPHIDVHGAAYGDEKDKIFRDSDIFLYPTSHDAAPLVVLEALAYGLPVVCSNQGALPDMVTHAEMGFVCLSGTVEEYCRNVESCIEKIDIFSANARSRYLNQYSPQRFSEQLDAIFREASASQL